MRNPFEGLLSERQNALIAAILEGEASRIVASGAARSGKTLAGAIGFALLAGHLGGNWLIAAPYLAQINNILGEWERLFAGQLTTRRDQKKAYLRNAEFGLYAGHDAGSEMALRSPTYRGALVDEAVGVHPTFLEQVSVRCSASPMLVVLMTNPDSPYHPIRRDWIGRAAAGDADYHYERFTMLDNPSNPEGYYAKLERDLTGAMRARMLYGEWQLASGSVYGNIAMYTAKPHEGARELRRYIGADYGHRSPSHAVLIVEREVDGQAVRYIEREWRHAGVDADGQGDADLSVDEKAAALMSALGPADAIYVDPAAPAFIDALRRVSGGAPVSGGVNDVLVGIQQVQTAIERGRLFLDVEACPEAAREFAGYSWDERAALRGEEKPVKRDDHSCDAARYAVASTTLPTRAGVLDMRPRVERPSGTGFRHLVGSR